MVSSSNEPANGPASEAQHGGYHAIEAARRSGAQALFTLSGAHIFPLYDAAVGGSAAVEQAVEQGGNARSAERNGPLRLVDVRHEQTAVFAAEAVGKLTRVPGFAAVTAGPGVTNAISAVTGASMNGSPLVLIGGRAPEYRWGSGALQELDHVPILEPVTKAAWTVREAAAIGSGVQAAFELAASAHRGPVFMDIPMDVLFTPSLGDAGFDARFNPGSRPGFDPGSDSSTDLERAAELLRGSTRPVLVIGSDVWAGNAVDEMRAFAHETGIPVIANGMGRGILDPDDPLVVTRARSTAFSDADVIVVVGAALDFRLGYGVFGAAAKAGGPPLPVVHLIDSPSQIAAHAPHAQPVVGDLAVNLAALNEAVGGSIASPQWVAQLADNARSAWAADEPLLTSQANPIHPARIYGELRQRLDPTDIVIGDGGDFVSFAGRFIEPRMPGRWLDPGPFGCLGTGPGYALGSAIAHPDSHPWLLMGDGAAGFSLMDVDTLVRHQVPVTMVVGNNAGWGLEKHPMRFLYGYDVLADLNATSYDDVVTALGGAGETVTEPDQIGPALDSARDYRGPYLVNVLTDPEVAYPRSTTGI